MYICECMSVCIGLCIRMCECLYIGVCMCMRMCVSVCIYVCACMCMFVSACIYAYICVYVCVSVCLCVYVMYTSSSNDTQISCFHILCEFLLIVVICAFLFAMSGDACVVWILLGKNNRQL